MNRALDRRFAEVNTKSASAVQAEVLHIFVRLFPGESLACVREAFGWVQEAFAGSYGEYQAIDAKYHDFEHTLQGTLCFARLLEGYKLAEAQPPLDRRMFELGLLAILLHDTGYLKTRADHQGTGAKYTLTHVNRSADFAAKLLGERSFTQAEVRAIQNMIRCTGVNTDLRSIPFQSEIERVMGFALGTADLLGQMAADDYVSKLDILFQEFDEANHFSGRSSGPGVYETVQELRRNTPAFWDKYVLPKINNDFRGLFEYLQTADGENTYIRRIEANIQRLRGELQEIAA